MRPGSPFRLALEVASGLAGEVRRAREVLSGRRRTPGARLHVGLLGLDRPVEVLVDRHGVPHIYAKREDDAFFVQGYLHASERLFQMDLLRRSAQGRLAEVFGDRPLGREAPSPHLRGRTLVDLDHYLRAFDLVGAALRSLARLSERTQQALRRYAQGINRFLEARDGRPPIEHRLLGLTPEPWAPADSVLLYKAFALELTVSLRAKLTFEGLRGRLAGHPELFAALLPDTGAAFREGMPPVVPGASELRALGRAAAGAGHVGSNSVVLAGRRSVTGRPLVASDPHLGLVAPTRFYEVHLAAEGLDVTGIGGAGLPGVAMGHNARVAWSLTLAYVDDVDLFLEELDGDGRVRRGERFEPVAERRELIRVKGRRPVERLVRVTSHGPLLSELFADGAPPAGAGAPSRFGLRRAYAVRWTGSDAGTDLDGLLGLCRAESLDDVRAAARHLHTPAWTLSYAETGGHIGWQLAGAVPRRGLRGGPLEATPGWDERAGWNGFVPFEELPGETDPQEGYVVAANQRLVDDAYPHYLSDLYAPPYRARRLVQLLEARPRHDVYDLRRMQLDVRSLFAGDVLEQVLRPFAQRSCALDVHVDGALAQLAAWDGEADAGSCAAAIFYCFVRAFAERLWRARLGDELCTEYLELRSLVLPPLQRILEDASSSWYAAASSLGALGVGTIGNRDALISDAMADAVAFLRQRFGDDPARWRWGSLHTATHRHPLGEQLGLGRVYNLGPHEAGGDGTTLNNAELNLAQPFEQGVGASARLVMDVGNWDRSGIILSTGQSGHPLSPQYQDQARLHRLGKLRPWPFSRSAVEDVTQRRVIFEPLTPGEG